MGDQPPVPNAQAGMQMSQDGLWVWNGTAWVPNPCVPLGLGMFIWGLIDAYQGAQRWNRRHGIIS